MQQRVPRSVFGVCGEHSGDLILKRIFRPRPSAMEDSRLLQPIEMVWTPPNTPGDQNELSRIPILFDGPKELGVMGLGFDLLKTLPNANRRLLQTTKRIATLKPSTVVTVDSKGFSLRLQQRVAKACPEVKRVHLCPPSIWAYKNGMTRAKTMVPFDVLGTVLPFEGYYWKLINVPNIKFVGYFAVETLLDAVGYEEQNMDDFQVERNVDGDDENRRQPSQNGLPLPHQVTELRNCGKLPRISNAQKEVVKRMFLDTHFSETIGYDDPLLVLAPGSRPNVVKSALLVMAKLLLELDRRKRHGYGICLLSTDNKDISSLLQGFKHTMETKLPNVPIRIVNDKDKIDVFQAATAAFAVSGTIVTEMQLFQVPAVVMYNAGGFITEYMARRIASVQYISLCNILSGQPHCPEFLFGQCENIKTICDEVDTILFARNDHQGAVEAISSVLDQLVVWRKDGGGPVRPSTMARHLISTC